MHAITNRHPLTDVGLLRAKEQIKSSIQLFILTFGMGCFFVAGTFRSFADKVVNASTAAGRSAAVPVTIHGHRPYAMSCDDLSDVRLRTHEANMTVTCVDQARAAGPKTVQLTAKP